jgi:hypothetical protein
MAWRGAALFYNSKVLSKDCCPGSLARQPCPAALQKKYKFNNRPLAGIIASFFTAVGWHAALHTSYSFLAISILSLVYKLIRKRG